MKSYAAAWHNKKVAEAEEHALVNRIKLLEREEARVNKSVQVAKLRTWQLQRQLKDKKQWKARKEEATLKHKRELIAKRERVAAFRRHSQIFSQIATQNVFTTNGDKARQVKSVLSHESRRKSVVEESTYSANRERVTNMRQEAALSSQRIRNFNVAYTEAVREAQKRKLLNEVAAKSVKEQEIAELEVLELEMIRKLQNTQKAHQDLLCELGFAI